MNDKKLFSILLRGPHSLEVKIVRDYTLASVHQKTADLIDDAAESGAGSFTSVEVKEISVDGMCGEVFSACYIE